MHSTDADVAPVALPPHWVMDEDADHVQTPSICPTPAGLDSVPQPASREDIVQDAGRFALSYARDFRALHQFNHDHDCTSTCIKYVAKQCRDAAQDALRKGKVVACRFFFFHILVFTYVTDALSGMSETITKRIRRRGQKAGAITLHCCHQRTQRVLQASLTKRYAFPISINRCGPELGSLQRRFPVHASNYRSQPFHGR